MNNILIKVENLVKTFGGLVALNDCSLEIKDKAITGIIGPNGSGKTTLFNVITGNLKPDTGKVFYNGVEITNEESHDLFHLGVLRTFQIAHEFSNMTVIENLMVVPGNQKGEKLLYSLMNSRKIKIYVDGPELKSREKLWLGTAVDLGNVAKLSSRPEWVMLPLSDVSMKICGVTVGSTKPGERFVMALQRQLSHCYDSDISLLRDMRESVQSSIIRRW